MAYSDDPPDVADICEIAGSSLDSVGGGGVTRSDERAITIIVAGENDIQNDRAIAELLQKDEEDHGSTIGADDDNGDNRKHTARTTSTDVLDLNESRTKSCEVIAADMQQLYTEQHERRVEEDEKNMLGSTSGKAWKFVELVLAMVDRLKQENMNGINDVVQPIAVDDMVYTTERLLIAQEEFRAAGKPSTVDVGYHYTDAVNLNSIKENGLLSCVERDANKVRSNRYNGAAYGKGLYSASSPEAYAGRYGDLGLMIARLRGVDVDYPANKGETYDSVTVHRSNATEFTVLSRSKQSIPLLQFPAETIIKGLDRHPGNATVRKHHVELQAILDEMFTSTSSVSAGRTHPRDYLPGERESHGADTAKSAQKKTRRAKNSRTDKARRKRDRASAPTPSFSWRSPTGESAMRRLVQAIFCIPPISSRPKPRTKTPCSGTSHAASVFPAFPVPELPIKCSTSTIFDALEVTCCSCFDTALLSSKREPQAVTTEEAKERSIIGV